MQDRFSKTLKSPKLSNQWIKDYAYYKICIVNITHGSAGFL